MSLIQLLFSFNGRISRQPYWLFTCAATILVLTPAIFIFGFVSDAAHTFFDASAFVLIWPAYAVQVKRWHDRDKSGWWVLVNLIPIVGFFVALVENGFLEGTPGENRFGSNPLHTTSSES